MMTMTATTNEPGVELAAAITRLRALEASERQTRAMEREGFRTHNALKVGCAMRLLELTWKRIDEARAEVIRLNGGR